MRTLILPMFALLLSALAPVVSAGGPKVAAARAPIGSAFGPVETAARAIVTQQPQYPRAARDLGIDGVVLLQVEIEESGKPLAISVANDDAHPLLRTAALKSVRQWQFEPATVGGRPVHSLLTVPVRFELLSDGDNHGALVGPAARKSL